MNNLSDFERGFIKEYDNKIVSQYRVPGVYRGDIGGDKMVRITLCMANNPYSVCSRPCLVLLVLISTEYEEKKPETTVLSICLRIWGIIIDYCLVHYNHIQYLKYEDNQIGSDVVSLVEWLILIMVVTYNRVW